MSSYYVKIKGRVHGPVSLDGIQRLVKRGVVTPTTELSLDGRHWQRAGEREEVFPAVEAEGAHVPHGDERSEEGWYYADSTGQVVGPVSVAQIESLLRGGQLTPETPVWCSQLPGWQPLRATALASLLHGEAHSGFHMAPGTMGHAELRRLPRFSRRSLLPEERVVYVAEVHPFFFVGPLVVLLAVSGSVLFLPLRNGGERLALFALLCLLWGGTIAYLLLEYFLSECVVTDRRLIGTTGVMSRYSVVVHLSEISAIFVRQGPLGKLLGYGTLVVACPGVEGNWWWHNVAFRHRGRIEELAKVVSSCALRARTSGGMGREPGVSPAA